MKKWLFLLLFVMPGVSLATELPTLPGAAMTSPTSYLSQVTVIKQIASMYGTSTAVTRTSYLIQLISMLVHASTTPQSKTKAAF